MLSRNLWWRRQDVCRGETLEYRGYDVGVSRSLWCRLGGWQLNRDGHTIVSQRRRKLESDSLLGMAETGRAESQVDGYGLARGCRRIGLQRRQPWNLRLTC